MYLKKKKKQQQQPCLTPPPPVSVEWPTQDPPSPSIGPIFDEPDTIESLNNVPTPCSIITGSYSTLLS